MTSARAVAAFDLALALATAAVIAWGVLVLGWSPFVVMLLFWFENVVIGGFNVAKMLATGLRLGAAGLLGGVALSAFFTVHYGIFTAVHGMFVVLLFGGAEVGRGAMDGGLAGPLAAMVDYLFAERDGWLAVAAIVLVHLSGFVQWLARTREAAAAAEGTDGRAVRADHDPARHADRERLPGAGAEGAGGRRAAAGRPQARVRPRHAGPRPDEGTGPGSPGAKVRPPVADRTEATR